jgi:hypothetical protein
LAAPLIAQALPLQGAPLNTVWGAPALEGDAYDAEGNQRRLLRPAGREQPGANDDATEQLPTRLAQSSVQHRASLASDWVAHVTNVQQTRGLNLVVTLPVLFDRLDQLERSKVVSERRARELLAERGLTTAVVQEARRLLPNASPLPSLPPPTSRRAPTLDALWAWYLEWSQTARATIHDRRLLRVLGFKK